MTYPRLVTLWICSAGKSGDTDDIAMPKMIILLKEGNITSAILILRHDLEIHGPIGNFVEAQIFSDDATVEYATCDVDDAVLQSLVLLQIAEVVFEIIQVVCDLELVREGIWLEGLLHPLHGAQAVLEVLLAVHVSYWC
jgi:hypothetical protein